MMMWQGTGDQLIHDSVDFYRPVATRYGNGTADFAGLQPWFRYYAPGGFQWSKSMPVPGAPNYEAGVGRRKGNVERTWRATSTQMALNHCFWCSFLLPLLSDKQWHAVSVHRARHC